MNKVKSVFVKNPSFTGRQFFAPLNRYLKPRETVDVVEICDGDAELAAKIAQNYQESAAFEVFIIHETLSTPEGLIQDAAQAKAFEEPEAPKEEVSVLSKSKQKKLQRAQQRWNQNNVQPVAVQELDGAPAGDSSEPESDGPL